MKRSTLAKGLVSAALVCFGCFLWAGTASAQEDNVVQGQNGSTASAAASSPAVAGNGLVFQAGPSANGGNAPAQAAQNGDNVGSHSQSAEAKSGDASAGSQVTGAVGGGATVQKQNNSTGAVAVSGPAVAVNADATQLGPQANAGNAPAQASQSGSNAYHGAQVAVASSGDAVAGAQVTGIVGVGDHTVQGQNTATAPVALTGPVVAVNIGSVSAGPNALAQGAPASASQVGDNDAVLLQANRATSGDSVAGSQVTGIVGNGSSTVQNQSSATAPIAVSGPVLSANLAINISAGPAANGGNAPAQASQLGDNSVEVAQAVEAASGDAVAGGQVTGLVGDVAGHVTVQNQQTSTGDIAFSGFVVGFGNVAAAVNVGPMALAGNDVASASQAGNNDFALAQDATLTSGDALAGAQVTGVVGGGDVDIQNQNTSTVGIAISGPVVVGAANAVAGVAVGPAALSAGAPASASQLGNNAVAVAQTASLTSGDAIAGSQVTGVVDDPSVVRVQNQNTSFGAFSLSGVVASVVVNGYFGASHGPVAVSLAAPAQASQTGSNAAAVDQAADLASGDAVAGSQVTGVVSNNGSATVQNQSNSVASFAVSGFVVPITVNVVAGTVSGPSALGIVGTASASQLGSNASSVDQHAIAHSGDAVAGGQVTGVVTAGGHVTVQNQNNSLGALAVSGFVTPVVSNVAVGVLVGPNAIGIVGATSASQIGSNAVAVEQDVVASSGDAVAGAQVTGIVTRSGDVTVQNANTSVLAVAITGRAGSPFSNALIGLSVGPQALGISLGTSASQAGSNAVSVQQGALATSGDAVAGSQVTGSVNGSGDVTIQAQNSSFASFAFTANATATNVAVAMHAGPLAIGVGLGASAGQIGNTTLDLSQFAGASTGDAVAGAQVIGTAEDDSKVQLQNFGTLSVAVTLNAITANVATGTVGPVAFGFPSAGSAQHLGNSAVSADQAGDAETGDAISGGQVTGVAGFGSGGLHAGGSLSPTGADVQDASFEISTSAAS